MMHFIDHSMDKALLLLDKETGGEAGKILAYYSNNPAGSVCHASVILYNKGWQILETCNPSLKRPENWNSEGKAGGYGYDKFSAAVSDSLHKMGLAGLHDGIKDFTFGNGNTWSEESQKIKADAIQAIKDKAIIPVYSGAGNVREAFELYFRVIEVL
jgi:hypothetical protein